MQAGFYPSVELKPANRSPIVGTARQGAAVSAGRTASTWFDRSVTIPMNSFPPASADTGHERPARTRGQERSSSCLRSPFLPARCARVPTSIN